MKAIFKNIKQAEAFLEELKSSSVNTEILIKIDCSREQEDSVLEKIKDCDGVIYLERPKLSFWKVYMNNEVVETIK